MILLKLDFEKAFDKVDHEVIAQVIRHNNFLDSVTPCFSQGNKALEMPPPLPTLEQVLVMQAQMLQTMQHNMVNM
jgi:hypothetical protein